MTPSTLAQTIGARPLFSAQSAASLACSPAREAPSTLSNTKSREKSFIASRPVSAETSAAILAAACSS